MMMSINLTGAFLTTKHAVREMKRNRYGRIVNISSTAAAGGGYRGASPSSASKAGLVGLTKMVAFECGLDGRPLRNAPDREMETFRMPGNGLVDRFGARRPCCGRTSPVRL
jgi:3-oxoacyl-[acyl-carrier protein] reductase